MGFLGKFSYTYIYVHISRYITIIFDFLYIITTYYPVYTIIQYHFSIKKKEKQKKEEQKGKKIMKIELSISE